MHKSKFLLPPKLPWSYYVLVSLKILLAQVLSLNCFFSIPDHTRKDAAT
jgi:hypothetical protein